MARVIGGWGDRSGEGFEHFRGDRQHRSVCNIAGATTSIPSETAPRRRGRPRDPAKREAILLAARSLFLRDGVDGVTMDRIVIASGVARATVYSYFADKIAVLDAVMVKETERIIGDEWPDERLQLDARSALIQFGERLIAFISDPDLVDGERLVAQLARTAPEHGRRLFAAGPERALAILARLIQAGQASGAVGPGDAGSAARDLMGLWHGFWRTELMFGMRSSPTPTEARELAHHGVEQFFSLYKSPDSSEP